MPARALNRETDKGNGFGAREREQQPEGGLCQQQ